MIRIYDEQYDNNGVLKDVYSRNFIPGRHSGS